MTVFSNLSKESKAEYAIQLTIMDAFEKGCKTQKELREYMKTESFLNAVKRYIAMMD